MKKFALISLVAAFALVVSGCSKVEKNPPNAGQKLESSAAKQAKGEGGPEAVGAGAVKEGTVVEKGLQEKEGEECALREFPNIHFAFDRYDLNDEARRILAEIAEYMKRCPDITLTIEGHCDERGSNEYNLALGWKRANEAKRFLVTLGVDPSRITTISYGEEKPLCFEHNEACWAKNRRDHFDFCRGECAR